MAAPSSSAKFKPDTTSGDYDAMAPHWSLAADLLDGVEAVRAGGEKYLPRQPGESREDYDYRRKTAKYVNIYRDILESLASKAMRKEVSIKSGASAKLETLAEDIDGQGNSLHVFAARTFFDGIAFGLDWIYVDNSGDGSATTVQEERAQGVRPYWVKIAARDVLAVETAQIGGRREVVHARFRENKTVRDGFDEKCVARIRVLTREKLASGSYGPVTWQVYEQEDRPGVGTKEWVLVQKGKMSLGTIPLVPFVTGRRKGGFNIVPPMKDAATLQLEHYQAESEAKHIRMLTAFPMLCGQGINPEPGGGTLEVGPNRVLFAPPSSDGRAGWSFIEPNGQSLKVLADNIDAIERQLREIGRQPLTAQTGNLTVVSTAFAASKANSVISAWALNLKDALEQALKLTALWMGETAEPEVDIEEDFDVALSGDQDLLTLSAARDARDISRETYWSELKRRGVLSAEFDPAAERERLSAETPDPYPGLAA